MGIQNTILNGRKKDKAHTTPPTDTMLQLISWNVKGLRSPQKRMMVLRHLKKLRADIVLLQETHLGKDDLKRMRKLWVGKVIGLERHDRKAGVAILMRKNANIKITHVEQDTMDRRVSAWVTTPVDAFRLANIYAPTQTYYPELSTWMAMYANQPHFIGGISTR